MEKQEEQSSLTELMWDGDASMSAAAWVGVTPGVEPSETHDTNDIFKILTEPQPSLCECRRTLEEERNVFLHSQKDFCASYEGYAIFCLDLCDPMIVVRQNRACVNALSKWTFEDHAYSTILGSAVLDAVQIFTCHRKLLNKSFTIVHKKQARIIPFTITAIRRSRIKRTALFLVCCKISS